MGKEDADDKRAVRHHYYKILTATRSCDYYIQTAESINQYPNNKNKIFYKGLIGIKHKNNKDKNRMFILHTSWIAMLKDDTIIRVSKKEFNKIALLAVI